MCTATDLQLVQRGQAEPVILQSFNVQHDRLATSSDHRLKIWHSSNGIWELLDSWRAHNAEITDVRWNGPLNGSSLGSIAEDGNFKLWQEDFGQVPRNARRFKCIFSLASKSKFPWASLDFKNVGYETYLGLVTYDGSLSILEPRDPENLAGEWSDWMDNQDFFVCEPVPHRSEETSFRLSFSQDSLPSWGALAAGLDPKALSMAVPCRHMARVFRTDGRRGLHLAAELQGAGDLIRDVAWAPHSVGGFDVIATASKDGHVRVYEMRTLGPEFKTAQVAERSDTSEAWRRSATRGRFTEPFGPVTRLVEACEADGQAQTLGSGPARLRHEVKLISDIDVQAGVLWRVSFSHDGQILSSVGDDQITRSYKYGVDMVWHKLSEIEFRNSSRS